MTLQRVFAYGGTVHFTSSDTGPVGAKLPGDSTLAGGSASFSTTLEDTGTGMQTITATDTVTASITGVTSISVTASTAPSITSDNPPNGTVGVTYGTTPVVVQRCFWVFRGGWFLNCSPCVPASSCSSLPICSSAHVSPCKRTVSTFAPFTFTASGGVLGYSWSASGMPPGLTLESNGQIQGTPTSANTSGFNITVTVTDSGNPPASMTANFTIIINPPPLPVVNTTPPPPSGVQNQPYSFTFTATGYQPSTFTWSESGMLPSGLAFDSSTHTLSGTPTQPGSFTITVTATDQFNQSSRDK